MEQLIILRISISYTAWKTDLIKIHDFCLMQKHFFEMHTNFCSENLKGREYSEDLGVDGRIILESILWN